MLGETKESTRFGHDRVLDSGYLGFRNTDISHIELDLDQNKALYYDRFNIPRLSYSEDDFQTSVVLDSYDVPWIVDSIDDSSHYYNSEFNRFLPAYHPEITDHIDFISEIWRDKNTGRKKRLKIPDINFFFHFFGASE